MFKRFFILLLALISMQLLGQDKIITSKADSLRVIEPDTISYWKKSNVVGLDLTQITFLNWSIGGNNSVSGLIKGRFERRYERKKYSWVNDLNIRYGLNKQQNQELRKTDDLFQFVSTFGYKSQEDHKWYYSSKFNFNTQFTNGYNYPNKDQIISHSFAPAYIFLGVGAEYKNNSKKLNFYISPLTLKTTLVLNQTLANQGAFGVKKAEYDELGELIRKGKKSRTELGFLFTNQWKTEIYENINFENRLSLYSDYINKFGNIDIDWQMQFDFVVNKYVRANINTHFIYDDDIKAVEKIDGKQISVGPKLQLKQILGVGLSYTF